MHQTQTIKLSGVVQTREQKISTEKYCAKHKLYYNDSIIIIYVSYYYVSVSY